MRRGITQSCGCSHREKAKSDNTTHGGTGTRLHHIWLNIRQRCRNKNHPRYEDYGGRGIDVCDEWYDSFVSFRDWSIANGYNDALTIDRINNNDGYRPDNCRWATYSQQARNTRRNHIIEHDGKKLTLIDWAEATGINYSVLSRRINAYGWSERDALTH